MCASKFSSEIRCCIRIALWVNYLALDLHGGCQLSSGSMSLLPWVCNVQESHCHDMLAHGWLSCGHHPDTQNYERSDIWQSDSCRWNPELVFSNMSSWRKRAGGTCLVLNSTVSWNATEVDLWLFLLFCMTFPAQIDPIGLRYSAERVTVLHDVHWEPLHGNIDVRMEPFGIQIICLFPILTTCAQLCPTFSNSFECLTKIQSWIPPSHSFQLSSYCEVTVEWELTSLFENNGPQKKARTHIFQSSWFWCFSFLSSYLSVLSSVREAESGSLLHRMTKVWWPLFNFSETFLAIMSTWSSNHTSGHINERSECEPERELYMRVCRVTVRHAGAEIPECPFTVEQMPVLCGIHM